MRDRPGYSFDPGPPPEASAFLRNKGLTPSFAWDDVEPEEHATAFTVAKAMQADVLEDIRTEVQRALDEGRTLAQFQRDLKPKLAAKGWWGRTEMTDPLTGEVREVQLGSPRRLRTIYRSNLRSARAAGQWERIQRTKAALPYLLYQLGPSERHRPEHKEKNGLVLPADDPFWQQWYPPNGWGCKCWVRQITRAEAESRGINVAPAVPQKEIRNRRTGEVRRVPEGIDPAWVGNPGALRVSRMHDMLAGKLRDAPAGVRAQVERDIATSWYAARLAEAGVIDTDTPILSQIAAIAAWFRAE
ncbi:phage head morphogenesis protein [Meridianimarinicoccus sp. RP-17]|uniref:phage head morphogenesis protein n=1 Tax=Meridianimarinicoccus zhengii TaxID=2056810 RepID=UPI000DACBD52|nr:phage minor head protein [Phycocomes zhengii]